MKNPDNIKAADGRGIGERRREGRDPTFGMTISAPALKPIQRDA